jgi:hypothetical protein
VVLVWHECFVSAMLVVQEKWEVKRQGITVCLL